MSVESHSYKHVNALDEHCITFILFVLAANIACTGKNIKYAFRLRRMRRRVNLGFDDPVAGLGIHQEVDSGTNVR